MKKSNSNKMQTRKDIHVHPHDNGHDTQGEVQLSDFVKVRELQLRLHFRNQLLDLIRAAYQRDVLILREMLIKFTSSSYMLDSQAQNPYPSHVNLLEILKSVPSIDLRKDGFFLFYPEECELHIRPCFHCGGRLEIVHRESARIISLIESCDALKLKEKELEERILEKDDQLYRLQESLASVNSDALSRSVQQETRIMDMEQKIVDRDFLLEKCRYQEEQIQSMEEICNQNCVIEQRLIEVERDKQEQYHHLFQINTELEKSHSDLMREHEGAVSRISSLSSHVRELEIRNKEMCEVIKQLEELEKQLQYEVEVTKRTLNSQTLTLKQYENDQNNLQVKIDCITFERNKSVSDLGDQLKEANDRILHLEQDLQNAVHEANKLEMHYSDEMDRRDQLESTKRKEAENAINDLTERVNLLVNLTSSYVHGLFDHCHAQEKTLRAENFLPDRYKNHRKTGNTKSEIDFDETNETIPNLLQYHLGKGMDFNTINWESILQNEDDKRKSLVYLNNRIQINHDQFGNLISKLHRKYQSSTKWLEEKHLKDLQEERTISREKNQELVKFLEEKEEIIKDLICKVDDLKGEVDCQISFNQKLRLKDEESCSTMALLEKDKNSLLEEVSTIKSELSKLSDEVGKFRDENTKQLRKDVDFRDETLLQLEGCLQKTTMLYNQKLKDEAHRLVTNGSVGIQVIPEVKHFQQQIDFLDFI